MQCPDVSKPYVKQGAGAPRGLCEEEHFNYAKGIKHEYEELKMDDLPEDLQEAIGWEAQHSPEQLDEFAAEVMAELMMRAASMEGERQDWLRQLPE